MPEPSFVPRGNLCFCHVLVESRRQLLPVTRCALAPSVLACKKVDTKLLSEAVDGMKIQLEDKLFAVVANDEGGANLDECFREAREILDAAGNLLGWPYILRERLVGVINEEVRCSRFGQHVSVHPSIFCQSLIMPFAAGNLADTKVSWRVRSSERPLLLILAMAYIMYESVPYIW